MRGMMWLGLVAGVGLAQGFAIGAAVAAETKPVAGATGGVEKAPVITVAAATHASRADDGTAAPKASLTKAPTAKPKRKRRSNAVVATIDLSRQRMTVVEHGRTIGTWTISSGKRGHLTPRGSFRPQWRSKMWYSRKYNGAPMPYAVFFNGGIATHGTNHLGALGRPASHGCIRLRTPNARRFYKLVSKHGKSRVRIIVKGTTPLRSKRYAAKKPRSVNRRRSAKRTHTTRRRVSRRVVARASNRRVSVGRVRTVRKVRRQQPRVRVAAPRRLVFPGDTH